MAYDPQSSSRLIDRLRYDVANLSLRMAVISDVKPSGTSGGDIVMETWTPRDLTSITHDPAGLVTNLENNTFTLRGGHSYLLRVTSPFHATQRTLLRLWNVTFDALVNYGRTCHVDNQSTTDAMLTAFVSPARDTQYRIEYWAHQTGTDSLGKPNGIPNVSESYTEVEITRLNHLTP